MHIAWSRSSFPLRAAGRAGNPTRPARPPGTVSLPVRMATSVATAVELPAELVARAQEAGVDVPAVCRDALEMELCARPDVLRAAVSDYFRRQAAWRRREEQDYPDDPRNERCAMALDHLSQAVLSIEDDHPLLAVARVEIGYGGPGIIDPRPEGGAAHAATHFHFHPSDNEADDAFLVWFAHSWARDLVASVPHASHAPSADKGVEPTSPNVGDPVAPQRTSASRV